MPWIKRADCTTNVTYENARIADVYPLSVTNPGVTLTKVDDTRPS